MKNIKTNVGSFATAKLQAKRRSLLAIITLVAVIGFSMVSCAEEEESSGSLNITGIPAEYIGKFAFGLGELGELDMTEGIIRYFAAESMDGFFMTGTEVIGDSVTLNVWKVVDNGTVGYNGSDLITFAICFFEKAKPVEGELLDPYGYTTVKFEKGTASGVFSLLPSGGEEEESGPIVKKGLTLF